MSSNFRRHQTPRALFKQEPSFTTHYTIGHVYAKRLQPVMGVQEIAAKLNISHQRVANESYVALGKLIYGLVHTVGEIPES